MSILIIAEHDHQALKSSTAHVVSAALKLGSDVHVLVMGTHCDGAAKAAAALKGVTKVLKADHAAFEHFIAENLTPCALSIAKNYSHILAPATSFGKNLLPRIAALLDVQQISDVISIDSNDTFKRPFYAGNAIATVLSTDPLKLLTIRTTAFDRAPDGGNAAIESIESPPQTATTNFVSQELSKSERPELAAARIVVSAGRGIGSGENYKTLIEPLADKLGAALGASRAAVDAGYVPNDYQVGQTGKIVAPELYVAIGISGAIQHLAGMKDSKVIVAINKDPEAPIFQVADYGLVADLFQAIPELTQKV